MRRTGPRTGEQVGDDQQKLSQFQTQAQVEDAHDAPVSRSSDWCPKAVILTAAWYSRPRSREWSVLRKSKSYNHLSLSVGPSHISAESGARLAFLPHKGTDQHGLDTNVGSYLLTDPLSGWTHLSPGLPVRPGLPQPHIGPAASTRVPAPLRLVKCASLIGFLYQAIRATASGESRPGGQHG